MSLLAGSSALDRIDHPDWPRHNSNMSIPGLFHRTIADTPVAVLDFETTGLYPWTDRVVEVCVVRINPGESPRLVLDTLVNPNRPMGATHVHGITAAAVSDAPPFAEIAGRLAHALAGCVVAAYNSSFDVGFLDAEFRRAGVAHAFPHLCLMYLRPMLGLGMRCKLADACHAHAIDHRHHHTAAADTRAAAALWPVCRARMADLNVTTYRDLAAIKKYKFVSSFDRSPLPAPSVPPMGRVKSRIMGAH